MWLEDSEQRMSGIYRDRGGFEKKSFSFLFFSFLFQEKKNHFLPWMKAV